MAKSNLKFNDFNLAPPKKPSVLFNWVLPIFLFGGTLAAVLVAGVFYPQIEMFALRYEKGTLDKQLEMLSASNVEYDALSAEVAAKRANVDIVKRFKDEATTVYEIYAALDGVRPRGVDFTSLSFSDGVAQISGKSPDEASIHTFALALEKDGRLTAWNITSVTEGEFGAEWTFEMTAKYKVKDVVGTDGQVAAQ